MCSVISVKVLSYEALFQESCPIGDDLETLIEVTLTSESRKNESPLTREI